jgi:hypothetical protein
MKSNESRVDVFLTETGKLATQFGWPAKSLERGAEVVLVALIEEDSTFERFIWIYDTERITLRCMLVGRTTISSQKQLAILELCARVNEGLPFGCLEYSFGDCILVFRDSADLDWGPLETVIGGTTARVLNLGRRYAPAIQSTLDGEKPEKSVNDIN